jgi:hypothetical protein
MGTIHSKRFAAAADQLHALRSMIESYVRNHWRAAHHKAIEQRRAAGNRLMAVQPPNVRLDCHIAQFTAIVDRAWNEHMAPALPESLTRC